MLGLDLYKPYETRTIISDLVSFEGLFYLYFFIINQTLGIVHEGGHGICYIIPCPQFITALNGTIFQLAFPFLIGYYYYIKNKSKIAWYTGLFFLGFSMKYTAWYISTSQKMGAVVRAKDSFLGVDSYHDFYYILDTMGILAYDGVVSVIVSIIATIVLLYCLTRIFLIAFLTKND